MIPSTGKHRTHRGFYQKKNNPGLCFAENSVNNRDKVNFMGEKRMRPGMGMRFVNNVVVMKDYCLL